MLGIVRDSRDGLSRDEIVVVDLHVYYDDFLEEVVVAWVEYELFAISDINYGISLLKS